MVSFMQRLRWVAVAVAALGGGSYAADAPADASARDFPIADGPARPDIETLRNYECPEWFRDAKFGIRTQWGPQSVPELGDGYARTMSVPGRRAYDYHVAHFGPPQQAGYDAVIAKWTAGKFDPAALVARFAAAGARYVVTLGADRDNFDLWNSSHHRGNAVNFGPKRDIVGAWASAVRAQRLRFGVSEHLAASPEYLSGGNLESAVPDPAAWPKAWFGRVRELIDLHRPDVLFVDGGVPFGEAGRRLIAHYYNQGLLWHDDLEVVCTLKSRPGAGGEYIEGIAVEDVERGSKAAIAPTLWQCDTALNDWIYDRDAPMRPTTAVIHQLIDVVSKNGNLLLNVPLRADGTMPDEAGAVLDEIGAWMKLNGEAIYGTRPWSVFGEGPTETIGGALGENKTLSYTSEDIRYTAKRWFDKEVEHETVYAILLGWPGAGEEVVLSALPAGPKARPIGVVRLLGYEGALRMVRDRQGLHIQLPAEAPCRHAVVFRVD